MSYVIPTGEPTAEEMRQVSRFCDTTGIYGHGFIDPADEPLTAEDMDAIRRAKAAIAAADGVEPANQAR